MARDAGIEARLLRWAEGLKSGDGNGYPVMSVLHEDWSPPSPGVTPTMKVTVGQSDVRQTHRIVERMSERMRATVVAHYVLRMSARDAAAVLDCAERTVAERIDQAHCFVQRALADGI
jgi:DNA-directed RNA polymerase specialized sigma24 family protein